MLARVLCVVSFAAAAVCAKGAVQLNVLPGAISNTNPEYASWTVDSSSNRGFFSIDFTNPNLAAAAASLSPSTVRFGGGGNDVLVYGVPPQPACSPLHNSDSYGCLNSSHWDNFYQMVKSSRSRFIFGLSFDNNASCQKKSAYKWNSSAAEAMVSYMQKHNQTVWAFEIGNEVNNKHKRCDLKPEQQAAAYQTFTRSLSAFFPDPRTRPLLIGPDAGYLDPQMWLEGFLKVFPDVHAVTYHVYSNVQKQNFNESKIVDHAVWDLSWYPSLVKQLAPQAQIWAGEDGPIGGGDTGDCGDEAHSVCGKYATSLWYANDLGLRAQHGFSQYQRQDLLGGRYGLLGIQDDDQRLGAKDPVHVQPNFWVAFLWKRIMGGQVMNVTTSDASVRAYAHCGLPPSLYRASSQGEGMVLINLASSVQLVQLEAPYTAWSLTPDGSPFSDATLLNKQKLPQVIGDAVEIKRIPLKGVQGQGTLQLEPFSVSFLAGGFACQRGERVIV